MRIIYADSLFFLNVLVDYLLLASTAKLCCLPVRRWRWALGAAFGGAYAVAAVVRPEVFAMLSLKLLAGAATAVIGLGTKRAGRSILCFFALAAGFGGAVSALCTLAGLNPAQAYIPVNFAVLFGAFALCYAAVSLVFRSRAGNAGRRIIPVELRMGECSVTLRALVDTGNELRDAFTGLPVIVAEAQAAMPLFPERVREKLTRDPVEALGNLRELDCPGHPRLIFCRSAVSPWAAMLCFSPEGGKYALALTASKLSPDGEYDALINSE